MKKPAFKAILLTLVISLSIILGLAACAANPSTPTGQSLDTAPSNGSPTPQETVPASTLSTETEAPETIPTSAVPTTEAPTTEVPTTEVPTTELQTTGEWYNINIKFHDHKNDEFFVDNYVMELIEKTEREISFDELPELSDYYFYFGDYLEYTEDSNTYKYIKASFTDQNGTFLDTESLYLRDEFSLLYHNTEVTDSLEYILANGRNGFTYAADSLTLPEGEEGSFLSLYCSWPSRDGGGKSIDTTIPYKDGELVLGLPWDEVPDVSSVEITKVEP